MIIFTHKIKNNNQLKSIQNSQGTTLIEALMAAGLLGIMLAVITATITHFTDQQKVIAIHSLLSGIKSNINFALNSGLAWENTVSSPENSSLQTCLDRVPFSPPPPNVCAGITGGHWDTSSSDPAFRDAYILQFRSIEEVSGSPGVYKPLPHLVNVNVNGGGSNGLTVNGKECNNFDPVNGNDTCPIQVRLSWKYVCTSCQYPSARIYVRFMYKPQSDLLPINVVDYNTEVEKNNPAQNGGLQGDLSIHKVAADGYSSNVVGTTYHSSRVVSQSVYINPGLLIISGSFESSFAFSMTYFYQTGYITIVNSSGTVLPCAQESSAAALTPRLKSSFSCTQPIVTAGNYTINLTHDAYVSNPGSPVSPVLEKSFLDFFATNNK